MIIDRRHMIPCIDSQHIRRCKELVKAAIVLMSVIRNAELEPAIDCLLEDVGALVREEDPRHRRRLELLGRRPGVQVGE